MKKIIYPLLFNLIVLQSVFAQNEAKKLIEEVVEAVGGVDKLKEMKDVEYEYTFRSKEKGIKDVSIERYIFDGEKSFAHYTTREYYMFPDMKGEHTQYFDGAQTTSMIGESAITDEQPAYVSHFFRKTNFYWFNMMYKLLDPGINYKLMDKRTVDGTTYDVVEMTFGKGIGETSDRYMLYINPDTKLIDQFLFTVLGFGFSEPFLMKLKYEDVNGLKLTTYRQYAPANWQGEVIKEEWNEQISKRIKFNNGFTASNITKI